jgi:hypothetical protein
MTNTYIALSVIATAPSILSIFLLLKILKLRDAIKVLSVAYSRIESLSSLKNNDDLNNDVHKENFIKFLSDSRDWAYEYIQDIQEGVTHFVNEVEPEIAYFDEYGEVGSAYPHYHSMKKISSEYKELKKLLPIEETQ